MLLDLHLKCYIMSFFFRENLIYRTTLHPQEVLRRLDHVIEPEKLFRRKNDKLFEGRITGNTFSFRRIIHYRNSFLPQISGEVNEHYGGSEIKVKVVLNPVAGGFLLLAGSIMSIAWVWQLWEALTSDETLSDVLGPLLMVIGVYGITLIGYLPEHAKAKTALAKLFGVRPIS